MEVPRSSGSWSGWPLEGQKSAQRRSKPTPASLHAASAQQLEYGGPSCRLLRDLLGFEGGGRAGIVLHDREPHPGIDVMSPLWGKGGGNAALKDAFELAASDTTLSSQSSTTPEQVNATLRTYGIQIILCGAEAAVSFHTAGKEFGIRGVTEELFNLSGQVLGTC